MLNSSRLQISNNTSQSISEHLDETQFEKDACGLGMIVSIAGIKSRSIIDRSLKILAHLSHRGALGADGSTGDGAGILIQMPGDFLKSQFENYEVNDHLAHIMVPKNAAKNALNKFNQIALNFGGVVKGYRLVPVESSILGVQASMSEPQHIQILLEPLQIKQLHLLRAEFEKDCENCWITSLDAKTLVYKALVLPDQLADYFKDLNNPLLKSAIAIVHSRFSTNTLPAWHLAHPFFRLCHNGEINTIVGNRSWMSSRLGITPIEGLSDSATLDRMVDYLMNQQDLSLAEALTKLIPSAWEKFNHLDPEIKNYFSQSAINQEPWDGPAALAFSDGIVAGALLDRNGLRPCRYIVTPEQELILSSEVGVLGNISAIERGRLRPGTMILVDTDQKTIIKNDQIKKQLANNNTLSKKLLSLDDLKTTQPQIDLSIAPWGKDQLNFQLKNFGYTIEELERVLKPMFLNGEEVTSSMGSDTPLAILSDSPQLLFKYFRQSFAQVTNPPMDPIREKSVMSLSSYLGNKKDGNSCIYLHHPVLNQAELKLIKNLKTQTISTLYKAQNLTSHIQYLQSLALEAIKNGQEILVLSDQGSNSQMLSMPILLALSAVHTVLCKNGLRNRVGLVCETAEARDTHHIACLLGYGAEAVNLYLIEQYIQNLNSPHNFGNYKSAIGKGLLKIMSKMGISTLQSYCGAHPFEALGINSELVNQYFPNTPSRIGGLDINLIDEETRRRFQVNVNNSEISSGSEIHYRVQGEAHLWSPEAISQLQFATRKKSVESYNEFSQEVDRLSKYTLRGMLVPQNKDANTNILEISDVEPASEIVKYFTTGAMSFGALSQEAHETLAIAMNKIGAKSNSGEGGEDANRFLPEKNGDLKKSTIKQIASARFGVTAHYLMNATELQIKMAQGAKPGEGGQLPGPKVDSVIAKLRHSTPGVTLISPPPHHDIYSIEDLAQLIYDLRTINPQAQISVKLVSSPGVGTIAAGVAKAKADKILISGDGGGTGASPLSSIKSAGSPWELGLAEAQQTLVRHALRERVKLEVDGQLRNGKDVIIAALLGAEEFGFSTAPLIVEGCIMMRKCHLNTCPVGVATQDPELRQFFAGQPEHVINYFFFVAEEVRQILIKMGFKSLKEIIGRTDLLKYIQPLNHWKAHSICLGRLLVPVKSEVPGFKSELFRTKRWPHPIENIHLDLVQKFDEVLSGEISSKYIHEEITNTHRAVGARLSGELVHRWGPKGLKPGSIGVQFHGCAGQSFGAFLAQGINFKLIGEANDYVGKSLSGGQIVIQPRPEDISEGVIAGNTCFYGATSGEAFVRGMAGERFAVRNSGAQLVVEGVGDHGCEYMTGGVVVVLGSIGINFAAGMSGGFAFLYDPKNIAPQLINHEMVEVSKLDLARELMVYTLIEKHFELTQSKVAQKIIKSWLNEKNNFKQVIPTEFNQILQKQNLIVEASV